VHSAAQAKDKYKALSGEDYTYSASVKGDLFNQMRNYQRPKIWFHGYHHLVSIRLFAHSQFFALAG
jgi:hypothetical protein